MAATASKTRPGTTTAPKPRSPASIALVAHTTRQEWADQLAADVQAAHIALDPGRLGCTQNHIRAWQHHQDNTTTEWAMVVEDDALPIPDFLPQIGAALVAAPVDIVSFYLGRQRPPQYQPGIQTAVEHAADHDHAWIVAHRIFHAVALAIKTQHVPSLVRYISHNPYCHLDIDEAITEWAKYYGHLIGYTQPSLVDHRDTGSIATHRDGAPRGSGRVAYNTGSRGDDWHTEATFIP